MNLKKYEAKRNLQVTPEPKGKVIKLKKPKDSRKIHKTIFVIQKHDASHLHYDFRLEMHGVLKSWAVPKGISKDITVKRLAVHVEDHPLEYAKFEGIIPKGHYGAGSVKIWDKGFWESVDNNPKTAYKKGDITVRLQGQKLKGLWKLIKIRSKTSKDNAWLLFKIKEKILNKNNKVGKKGILPKTFTPELCFLTKEVPKGDEWLHEIKYDGYRIIAIVENGNVKLLTRRGLDWSHKLPSIVKILQTLPVKNAVLDGELTAVDKKGVSHFQILQNAFSNENLVSKATLALFIFDLPFYNDYNLQKLPLIERKNLLQVLFKSWKQPTVKNTKINYADHILGQGEKVYKKACLMKLEGTISKNIHAPYIQKRTHDWLKNKCHQRQEFVIGGFSKPGGARKHFGALLLGYYNHKNQLIYSGRVGTGFTEQSLKEIYQQLNKLVQDRPSFSVLPKEEARNKNVTWVKPTLIGEVAFFDWTDEGSLRHPSFLGLRLDKKKEEVKKEVPRQIIKIRKSKNSKNTIKLTNPDRIFGSTGNLTKKALADYYLEISDQILPHLIARPLSLVRCPSSSGDKCFYHKHYFPSFGQHIYPMETPLADDKKPYVSIKDKKGLLTLAQFDVLEIHPWGSKKPNLDKPDRIIFDLDPHEDVNWNTLKKATLIVKTALQKLGLKSFLKTTGGKGLHVVVPIRPKKHWTEVKAFCKNFSERMTAEYPEIFVSTATKSKRHGKIFLDYLRNAQGATAVACYSPRARVGAPVAVPLAWSELPKLKSSNQYNVFNVKKRLSKQKKDPWQGFFNCNQDLNI